jgi:SPP1 family phage portal protein
MKTERLQELLTSDTDKLKDAFDQEVGEKPELDTYQKQYEVSLHDVFDPVKRKDKPIKDENGSIVDTKKVARIGVPMQKIITQTAAAFLCGNPIKLVANAEENTVEKTLLEGIEKVWDDNKLDYKSMDLSEKMMSETEVAELWYTEELEDPAEYWGETQINGKFRLRMKVLAHSLGDQIRPIFDPTGNMIAFGRGYTLKSEGKTEQHFDVYTDKFFYHGVKTDQGWTVDPPVANMVQKIPVIYYAQPTPEWADVQTAIDRLETVLSRHADTNDYSGSPILFTSGEITSLPEKEQDGKAIQADEKADAKFLSWDHAPESIKMEIDNLFKVIYACTFTPDISFDALKGMGQTSGFAMECMFMGAHLKAAKKAGIFGEGVQRRINYLKAALSTIDLKLKKGISLKIKPQFEFFLPKDMEGLVNTLTTAVSGGIMSKDTGVRQLGIAEDVQAELAQIEQEANSAGALNEIMNQNQL